MENFFWAKLAEVEKEREGSKAQHLLRFLRKASKAICGCIFLFELLLFIMWIEQVSPDGATRLRKLRDLKFEAYEYDGEVWWYHSEELWYWESEVVS